jgi:hypothetical protein
MASTVGTRLAFEKAKEGIKAAGFNLGQAVLSQSYLRSELTLTTTQTLYQFPILVNDNSAPTTGSMNLLNLQDAFYCSEIALFFCAPSSPTATTFSLVSYPNATQFTAGSDIQLNNFYNGKLTMIINNRQIVPSLDLYRFYDAMQTQQPAVTNSVDQFSGKVSGFNPVEPGIVFVGSKQNVVQIQIPNALSSVQANSRVVLYMKGHLAQNVSSVR